MSWQGCIRDAMVRNTGIGSPSKICCGPRRACAPRSKWNAGPIWWQWSRTTSFWHDRRSSGGSTYRRITWYAGALVGAGLVSLIERIVPSLLPPDLRIAEAILGLVFIGFVLFARQGMVGLGTYAWLRVRRR